MRLGLFALWISSIFRLFFALLQVFPHVSYISVHAFYAQGISHNLNQTTRMKAHTMQAKSKRTVSKTSKWTGVLSNRCNSWRTGKLAVIYLRSSRANHSDWRLCQKQTMAQCNESRYVTCIVLWRGPSLHLSASNNYFVVLHRPNQGQCHMS